MVQLLDRYGGCPSVMSRYGVKDSEENELKIIWNVLLKTTLRDHSFRVTRIALDLLKDTYRDYENYIPKTIVTALAHDLGKIPELREEKYSKHDHPIINERIVAEMFKDKAELFWLKDVLAAIRNHHNRTEDQFTVLLKDADGRAREMEVSQFNKELQVLPRDKWFDVKEFLDLIRGQINVIQTGDMKAFAFQGNVYCTADCLYEAAGELAKAKKVVDITLYRDADQTVAVREIVNLLRAANVLSAEMKPNYTGLAYEVRRGVSSRRMFLVPIRIDAFGLPHEIERLGNPHLVDGVKPARQKEN